MRSARVHGNQTAFFSVLTNVHPLPIDCDVVQLDAEHVLQLDVVPANVTRELRLVVVPKGQIGLKTNVMVLLIRHEEGEHVALYQLLIHNFIKKRLFAFKC